MAMFPMEQHMYSWVEDNCTKPLNITFQPSSRPPDLPFTWLDAIRQLEFILPVALQNMSLAILALLALQEASMGKTKKYLSPVTRLLRSVGLYLVLMNVLKTLHGLVLLMLLVPVMLPFTVVFGVTSLLVKVYYALQWGSEVQKVEGLDGVWGVDREPKTYITACLKVHGTPDLHKVQQAFLTKILQVRENTGVYKYRKFRQLFLLRCGYCCWRDDPDFDINNHVKEIKLSSLLAEGTADDSQDEDAADEYNQKEEKESDDELLKRYLSEKMTAIPEDIPQWQVLLLARDDGSYNVLMRIHHAIGDGVTLVRLCVKTLVDTPMSPPPVGALPGNPFARFAFMLWSMMMLPFGFKKLMENCDRNALHGINLSGKKVLTWSSGIPLSVIRQVKNKTSTTINDVLMSCLSAALAKHFVRRKDDVQEVTAVVPVSFHDLSKPFTLTNQFSIAPIKLPVGKAITPSQRLRTMKEVMDETKKDPTLWAVHTVLKSTCDSLPAALTTYLFASHGITLAASNVPGPQQKITIWDDEVEDIMFWVPNMDPVGVGVSFFSYKGVVKIGLNMDLSLLESKAEAQQLLDDMEEELRLLHGRLLPQA